VDEIGVPLSIVVTGANRHDVTQLAAVLDGIMIERPETDQHLCADKGYAGEPAQQVIKDRHYVPHVKQRGEEIKGKKSNPDFRARRWVVEVTHSWFNRFRACLKSFQNQSNEGQYYHLEACSKLSFAVLPKSTAFIQPSK
jgi:transposase